MQTEWIHTLPPYELPLQIFNHYGEVRRGFCEAGYIRLTDCTYPMQNCVYPREQVVAWRHDQRGDEGVSNETTHAQGFNDLRRAIMRAAAEAGKQQTVDTAQTR